MCRPIPREITRPIQVPAISKAVATIDLPTTTPKKRVSFHETVDVQVIDRLDAFAVRELFYQPVDFRYFRYEVCMEKLEARAKQDPARSIFQSIISSMPLQRRTQTVPSSCTTEMRKAMNTPSPESLLRELAFVL